MRADDVYAILNKRIKNLQTAVTGGSSDTPVGAVISYMGTTAPANYLVCDGSAYNISEYQELASHFTNEFGSVNYFGGDGETTFAVPDLRGEFLRGSGTAERNSGSGANVGVHQNASRIREHWAYGNDSLNYYVTYFSKGEQGCSAVEEGDLIGPASEYCRTIRQNEFTNNTTNVLWQTTRPTNTSVLYCIKYKATNNNG